MGVKKVAEVTAEMELAEEHASDQVKRAAMVVRGLKVKVKEVGASKKTMVRAKLQLGAIASVFVVGGGIVGASAMVGEVGAAMLGVVALMLMGVVMSKVVGVVVRQGISIGILGAMFAMCRQGVVDDEGVDKLKGERLEVWL